MLKWTEELEAKLLNCSTKDDVIKFSKEYKITVDALNRKKRAIKERISKTKSYIGLGNKFDSTEYYEGQITKLQTEISRLREMLSFQEAMVSIAKSNLKALPNIQAPKPRKKEKEHNVSEIANLLLSDLHIGEIVRASETGNINSYDFNIFSKRLEQLAESIISIKYKMQGYNLEHLEIHALGDFITGIIHDELVQNSDDTIVEWLFNGALIVSQFLSDLLAEFGTIHFTGVVGNHGRMTQKKYFKRKYVNWDYIFYQIVALMMANNNRITFTIPESFWTIREVGGRKLLLLHGDSIKSWMGIPWYGIQRTVYKLTELLNSNSQFFDDVCIGHFHNTGTLTRTKGKILLNGSLVGGDEFSIGAMFTSCEPMQLFFGINPKHKRRTWEFPINLSDTNKAKGKYKYSKTIPIINQVKEYV